MCCVKTISIIFFIYICILTASFSEERQEIPEGCIKEYGDKYDKVDKKFNEEEIEQDYACFVICVYKNWSFVDADGDTKIDRFKKYDVNEYDLEQIDLCAKKYENMDVCVRSYKTQMCVEKYFKTM